MQKTATIENNVNQALRELCVLQLESCDEVTMRLIIKRQIQGKLQTIVKAIAQTLEFDPEFDETIDIRRDGNLIKRAILHVLNNQGRNIDNIVKELSVISGSKIFDRTPEARLYEILQKNKGQTSINPIPIIKALVLLYPEINETDNSKQELEQLKRKLESLIARIEPTLGIDFYQILDKSWPEIIQLLREDQVEFIEDKRNIEILPFIVKTLYIELQKFSLPENYQPTKLAQDIAKELDTKNHRLIDFILENFLELDSALKAFKIVAEVTGLGWNLPFDDTRVTSITELIETTQDSN